MKHIITKDTYEKIQEKAHKYGNKVLFIARFLPGLRAPLFLVAGVSHKVPFWKFILMDGLAAIISVPCLVYLGYFFANDLDIVVGWVKHSETVIVITVLLVVVGIVLYKNYKKKNAKK